MFIVENRKSQLTKRSWIWRVILLFLVFPFGAFTMHIYYNPQKQKVSRRLLLGGK
jgi:hypothetical protein